jgi:hypothetical protein
MLANLKHCVNLLSYCRQWYLTLVMRPCFQIGAYVGFALVMRGRPWMMLNFARWCDLAGQRPAIVKELPWCYWRLDRMLRSVSYFLQEHKFCLFFGKSIWFTYLPLVFRTMKRHVVHFLKVLNWSHGTQRLKKAYGMALAPFGYIQV